MARDVVAEKKLHKLVSRNEKNLKPPKTFGRITNRKYYYTDDIV